MKKKIVSVVTALSLSFGILSIPASASEISSKVDAPKSQQEQVIKSIKKHYKDEKVQKKLIEKRLKGEQFDAENQEKRGLGVQKKIDDYTIQTTYPDGSISVESVDLSEATFYDKDGKEISNPYGPLTEENKENKETKEQTPTKDKKTDQFSLANIFNSVVGFLQPPKAQAAVISGGTWSTGSAYACVKGAKVKKEVYSTYGISYSADWCNHKSGYDNLSRIYAVDVWSDGEFSILSQGVFRSWENVEYNAYGGVKIQVKPSPESKMTTEYLYLRVGDNTYWYQASY